MSALSATLRMAIVRYFMKDLPTRFRTVCRKVHALGRVFDFHLEDLCQEAG